MAWTIIRRHIPRSGRLQLMNSSSKGPALFVTNRDHCRAILMHFGNHGYGFELGSGFAGVVRKVGRSQWPRGLRRRSAAARLLRSWVRNPPRAWMSVCCKCCVLSGRGLCDELITRPEESYRLWCVVVCDLETS